MSEPNPDLAELTAEVAALSAIVAALFASLGNLNAQGSAEWLARYADAIARAGQADPECTAAIVSRIAQQATAATEAVREPR